VELAGADGARLEGGRGTARGGKLVWTPEGRYGAGVYWVRARSAGGGPLLREFGLRLR